MAPREQPVPQTLIDNMKANPNTADLVNARIGLHSISSVLTGLAATGA